MILRLTTPEAFDRLIDYLEKERDLVWPEWNGYKQTYRYCFMETVKEAMANDTVFLNVDWAYNDQTNRVEAKAYYSFYSEMQTEEEYMAEARKIDMAGK